MPRVAIRIHPGRPWWQDLRWITAGLVLLLLGTLVWGLFGPEPPITVSRETTYLTAPLAADRLPDYEAAWLDKSGPAPPPAENAAAPMLETCWPFGIDAAHLPLICQAVGIPHTPPAGPLVLNPKEDATAGIDDAMLDSAGVWPWTTEQVPAVAAWLTKHEAQIDRLVAAADRPRYWLPSPSLLDGKRAMLVEALLPDLQGLRDLARLTSLDWNLVLERWNGHYDEIESACRLPTHQARIDAMEAQQRTLSARAPASAWARLGDVLLQACSRRHRSDRVADRLLIMLSAPMWASVMAETRNEAQLVLTKTAAALAAWKADRAAGEEPYPETLSALVPKYLAAVPLDPFADKPFIYERRGDGYLLASVGDNGVYDGGNDVAGWIVGGEWQDQSQGVDRDAFDLVVRMPIPKRPPAFAPRP